MHALNKKLLRDLIQLRGQVIAIVLIVACGIASLVTMMSAYQSLKLSQQTYYDQYHFADIFVQLKRAPNSLAAQIAEIPGVQQVQSRVVVDVTLDVPGLPEPAVGRLISIPATQQPMLNDLYIRQGHYIQPEQRNQVLVSEPFANANHLQLGDAIGAVINGRWESLRIVGIALSPEYVYEIRGSDLFPDNKRFGVMWMERDALATAFDLDGAFNDVTLSLAPGASSADVIFRLDRLLDRYGGLGAYSRNDQISNRFLSDEISGLQATAYVVPVVFLGIAAFLLNLVLARLIQTQRDQIAVLKAFGYSNSDVGLHFFKLVLIVVLLGAAIGIGIGLWFGSTITRFYTNFYHFPLLKYQAGLGLMLGSVGVSAIAAILGAFNAVRAAVTLPPAEAMRPEPPKSFRPTIVERIGLQHWFSPAGRIILRNLERRPVQASLSILGISLAVAILIVGQFFNDAVQYIITVQFRTVQREDMTVVFNEPRSAQVKYDLAHLPGVLRVEPFRSVPVRLRFEYRSHLSGITGLQSQSDLHRLVNRDLKTVSLPPSGLVLTTKLAELLGAQIGDRITVEVLEAERPIRQVSLINTVDELVGVSAYMDIDALNALMREGSTYSGAYLTVDPNQIQTLYHTLKATPAIASVSLRQTAIDQFQKTIATSFGVFTTVLASFACVIAFGVVYNAARIALSERGRELATLRIIGFTRTEIAIILLGEQALLTLAAIPIGSILGFWFAALLTQAPSYNSELFRIPLVINRSTYGFAVMVISSAAIASAGLIWRQLQHLDLVAVLKTQE
jgi:putative ABC transport system permease protein